MTTNKPEVVVVNEDKMRAEFEAWAGSKKFGLSKGHFKKDEDSEYLNFPTQCYWDVWQASRAAPDVAGLVTALEEIARWTGRWASADHPVATVARKALAAYRKQGGEL